MKEKKSCVVLLCETITVGTSHLFLVFVLKNFMGFENFPPMPMCDRTAAVEALKLSFIP